MHIVALDANIMTYQSCLQGAQNIAILEDEVAPTWAAAVAALTSHPDCVGLEQLMYL